MRTATVNTEIHKDKQTVFELGKKSTSDSRFSLNSELTESAEIRKMIDHELVKPLLEEDGFSVVIEESDIEESRKNTYKDVPEPEMTLTELAQSEIKMPIN